MHLIYRSKKNPLPLVNDPKLAAYYPQITHSPTNPYFSRKKSIDVILSKHEKPKIQNATINDQILIYQQPLRRTHRASRTRKAESGYIKNPPKAELSQAKMESKYLTRNRSTELNEKAELWGQRKKGDSQYSPYLMTQHKKSRSNSKFKSTHQVITDGATIGGRDWVCEKFIQRQVYSLQQSSDFI